MLLLLGPAVQGKWGAGWDEEEWVSENDMEDIRVHLELCFWQVPGLRVRVPDNMRTWKGPRLWYTAKKWGWVSLSLWGAATSRLSTFLFWPPTTSAFSPRPWAVTRVLSGRVGQHLLRLLKGEECLFGLSLGALLCTLLHTHLLPPHLGQAKGTGLWARRGTHARGFAIGLMVAGWCVWKTDSSVSGSLDDHLKRSTGNWGKRLSKG